MHERNAERTSLGLELGCRIRYALTSSHALRSRDGSGSAIPAVRLPGSLHLTSTASFGNEQWYQTHQSTETELQQWHLREQQRTDGSASRELFRTSQGRNRTMPRRHVQFQPEPARHVFPPQWGGEVVMNDDGLGERGKGFALPDYPSPRIFARRCPRCTPVTGVLTTIMRTSGKFEQRV
jgi:hypothetical protein